MGISGGGDNNQSHGGDYQQYAKQYSGDYQKYISHSGGDNNQSQGGDYQQYMKQYAGDYQKYMKQDGHSDHGGQEIEESQSADAHVGASKATSVDKKLHMDVRSAHAD